MHLVRTIPERVALVRYTAGEKPFCSSDIRGDITVGFGKLHSNGDWEYPLPEPFRKNYLIHLMGDQPQFG